MNEQREISTVTDAEVYQAHNTLNDINAELENERWYFIDEEYGYIGPYHTKQEAKEALIKYCRYM